MSTSLFCILNGFIYGSAAECGSPSWPQMNAIPAHYTIILLSAVVILAEDCKYNWDLNLLIRLYHEHDLRLSAFFLGFRWVWCHWNFAGWSISLVRFNYLAKGLLLTDNDMEQGCCWIVETVPGLNESLCTLKPKFELRNHSLLPCESWLGYTKVEEMRKRELQCHELEQRERITQLAIGHAWNGNVLHSIRP